MHALAKDIMSPKLVKIYPKMTSQEAIELLIVNRISGAPVVNLEGKLLGVLSLYDLINGDLNYSYSKNAYETSELDTMLANEGFHVETACAGDVLDLMTRQVVTAYPDTSVEKIAADMLRLKIHRIIVIEPETQKPLGIISTFDILKLVESKPVHKKQPHVTLVSAS